MHLKLKPTVLLVDDNPYVINFLNKCFTNEDFEVISDYDAKYALELLTTENSPDIDIVITDYNMPIMNGLEFAHTLKEMVKYMYVPIILYTQHIYMNCKDEKYKVTVFTDTSCGYCRKLHSQMQGYNDLGITVQYLAFPRSGITGPTFKELTS